MLYSIYAPYKKPLKKKIGTKKLYKSLVSYEINFIKYLATNFSFNIKSINIINSYSFEIEISKKNISQIFLFIKNNTLFQFSTLTDIVCIDTISRFNRFTLMYLFNSIKNNIKLIVNLQLHEGDGIPSIHNIYESAAWLEREIWDMFGVYFLGHGSFRRLLTDYGFKGHPLRKDFPLTGFLEIFYDDFNSQILYVPVELAQEYRVFDFYSPWAKEIVL